MPTISDPTTTNTVLGSPTITSTTLSGSDLTVYFEHAPATKDLEIVAHGCSYYTVENGPAGGVDGFEVDQKSCTLNIPTNYPTVYVKAHAKYGNYVNCGTDNSSTCVQIDNAQWGPYTDWYSVTVFTPTTTTTTTTTTVPPSSEKIPILQQQVHQLLQQPQQLHCLHQTQLLQPLLASLWMKQNH